MLEIRHLRTLMALAETGNLSKAARMVNLSQPAASHQIKALEDSYGTALFERKSTPLKLTPAGHRLIALAYDIDRQVQSAERDVARIAQGEAGQLRIAVECHSCFDWLMPSMDVFRENWPEVEMDLVSGFHADPIGLLGENRADLVIVSQAKKRPEVSYQPLFRYEVSALVANHHPLAAKAYLTARDFAKETLVTYPIPDERLDVVREVLTPAKVYPQRRTTELTVAILQLVASRRAVAALPGWTIQPFLDRKYVRAKPIGKNGLFSNLYSATSDSLAEMAYMEDFIKTMKAVSFSSMKRISRLD